MKKYIKLSMDDTKLAPYLEELEDVLRGVGFRGDWESYFMYKISPMTITMRYVPSGREPAKILVTCDDKLSYTNSIYFVPDDFDFLYEDIDNFVKVANNSGSIQELMKYENENVPLHKNNFGATYRGKDDDLKWNGL